MARKPDAGPADEPRPAGPGPLPNLSPKPRDPVGKAAAPAVAAVPKTGLRETPPAGGFIAQTGYREHRKDGAVLIGFEADFGRVFNTDVVTYLRPIWLTPSGEEFGTAYGRAQGPVTTVKAKSGYAVGGIVVAGGGALEGFCLTFMRIGTKGLVANDAYTSDWYGEADRRPRANAMRSGDGSFVVGLYGKRFEDKGGKNFDDGGAIGTIGLVLWTNE
ncbi:hypothetical protein [Frigoriglobus tundricola]|uniref:hypothetical protein n=1 Tax=Frigoriglobus tundricola TaxID=2774151 RepID=UPI00148E9500|nr:hypothetical protein [Frigoriglobus tundricola]